MKKTVFLAAVAMSAIFASCSKDSEQTGVQPDGRQMVQITLTQEPLDVETRAFFDPIAYNESWEKEVKTATMFVFDNTGALVLRRNLTKSECYGIVTFALPDASPGKSFDFYIVANYAPGAITTETEISEGMDTTPLSAYNGAFGDVNTKCLRDEGFVMTGKMLNVTMPTDGTTKKLVMNIWRNVAKVAIESTLSSNFGLLYNGGTVEITRATIVGAASRSILINDNPTVVEPMTYTHMQYSNRTLNIYQQPVWQNLFYLYANPALAPDKYVTVLLDGVYDRDGDPQTTGDRTDVQYSFKLNPGDGGRISKNGYHRMSVTIKGLPGAGVEKTFTALSWSLPNNQSETAGL